MATVVRMCCACRAKKSPEQLIRVVRTPQGAFRVDPTGRADGRGCYICRDAACVEKGVKTRYLNRAYRCEIPSEVYQEVKDELYGKQ